MTNPLLDVLRASVVDAVDTYHRPQLHPWSKTGWLGCVLSGGIDSSTITTLAHEVSSDLPTFTGWYQGDLYDERKWARMVGGPNHHEIEITPQDFIDNIDDLLKMIGGKQVGPGIFGQYMVAKYASKHVDVVLSGEGGDELFGGYARLHIIAGIGRPDGYKNYRVPDDYPLDIESALRYDLAGLPGLLEVDAMATAPFGLRSVAPMTDIRVVAWALSQKPTDRVGKVLLREAVRGLVPGEILDRTDKMGMPVPFVEWANGPLKEFIGDRIGYVPAPSKPWDRKWWYDFCAGQTALV